MKASSISHNMFGQRAGLFFTVEAESLRGIDFEPPQGKGQAGQREDQREGI